VERERDVRILFACESSGRGWGFESQDSELPEHGFLAGEIARYEALQLKAPKRPPLAEMDRFFRGALQRAWEG